MPATKKPTAPRLLTLTLRFDADDSALILQAVDVFRQHHQDMTPTQLTKNGARRWAAEVVEQHASSPRP